jgi:ferredoxin--NADP+ reductase
MTKLRVAVVGAGPVGFFATAELLAHPELTPQVDMFDRLPTPYGLVRNGVAPDHQGIKAITAKYAKQADAGGLHYRSDFISLTNRVMLCFASPNSIMHFSL